MTNKEAIEILRIAQSVVEWEYPMNCAVAFDMAISAIEAQDVPDTNVGDKNEHTETHACDWVSRQAAIDALKERRDSAKEWYEEASASGDEMMSARAESAIMTFVECLLTIKKLPSAQPEQSEMIKDIRKWINSGNRGNADYFIVDKIEEIINKYERRYNQQTGGD